MSRYVPTALKKLVRERAKGVCEYCLAFEGHSFVKFQMEHIISIKHRGKTTAENLALSCFVCNSNKGTDLGTILENGIFTRFYNPRKDKWSEYFELANHLILPKSTIGEGTILILDLNHEERLIERISLIETNFFPHPNALSLIHN